MLLCQYSFGFILKNNDQAYIEKNLDEDVWIMIEISAFYLYMLSSAVYLLIIQMRGIFYDLPQYDIDNRWRYDALDYYQDDIQWFAFSFILAGLASLFIGLGKEVIGVYHSTSFADDPEGRVTEISRIYYMLWAIVAVRSCMMVLMW